MNPKIKHILALSNKTNKYEKNTTEWKNNRKDTFGGSEIYSILSSENAIHKKLNDPTQNNIYCIWGNIFEKCAIHFIKSFYFQYTYYESNTLYDTQTPLSYTPDGFLADKDNTYLVEIKCPFMASCKRPLKLEYKYQIQSGLYITDIKSCKFFQFEFRCCLDNDMKPHHVFQYYRKPHKKRFHILTHPPYLKGIILFPGNQPINIATNINLLTTIDTTNITYIYLNTTDNLPTNIQQPYLPWKLIDFSCQNINYDPTIIPNLKDTLWNKYTLLTQNSTQDPEPKINTPPTLVPHTPVDLDPIDPGKVDPTQVKPFDTQVIS